MKALRIVILSSLLLFASSVALSQQEDSRPQGDGVQTVNTYNKDLASRPLESVVSAPASTSTLQPQRTSPAAVVTRGPFVSVQVNIATGGGNIPGDAANEPSIAVDPTDPNKIAIGWRQFDTILNNFRQAGVAFTTDGGDSWTNNGPLDPGQFRSDPVLGSDGNGVFYYSSLSSLSSIEVFTSFDGGYMWGAPVPAFGGDKQWIAVARNCGIGAGNMYQIWNVQFTCCFVQDFTRTTDTGLSFDGPFAITTPSMKWGTMDVGPDGTLYLAGAALNGSGHLFTKSTNARDAGVRPTFDTPTSINLGGNIGLGAGPNPQGLLGQVWIAADQSTGPHQGNIYVLNSVDPPGSDPLNVNFIRSEDGGATWSAPIRVNDDSIGSNAWQWFGTMSVAPNGRIDVVFNDTRNSGIATISELFYTFSTDAGVTWAANVAVSPSFDSTLGWPDQSKLGDYYDMVSDSGGAYLAYAATFNGEQDVYFLRIPADCNENGVADETDISLGTSLDCNGNGAPDECDIVDGSAGGCDGDCNTNTIPDDCDIADGSSGDCNENAIPDECDIANGTSLDVDLNGEPDECGCVVASAPVPEMMEGPTGAFVVSRRSRMLAFGAGDAGRPQAIRVTYDDLPPPYDVLNGTELWVGQPQPLSELPGEGVGSPPTPGRAGFHFARLQCDPFYMDWSQLDGFCADGTCFGSLNAGDACTTNGDCADAVIHVTHKSLVPSKLESGAGPLEYAASYTVDVIDASCDAALPSEYSPSLPLNTSGWADTVSLVSGEWRAPDDIVSKGDLLAVLGKFTATPGYPSKTRVDLLGASKGPEPFLDLKISALDLVFLQGAFSGSPYPFPPEPTPICP